MIRHVMRIVWNRKRSTALMMTELLISFLVLCTVLSIGAYYLDNWRQPLGFDYEDVWSLSAFYPVANRNDPVERAALLATSRQVMNSIRSHSEVVVASPTANVPYSGGSNNWGTFLPDGTMARYLWSEVRPEIKEVYGLEVVEGRWLEDGDESLADLPIVITRSMGRMFFGEESPLGKIIPRLDETGAPREAEKYYHVQRVVGVVEIFRKSGELAQEPHAAFVARSLDDPERGRAPGGYVVRVEPGTTAAFEEQLISSLQQIAPEWSFEVEPVATMRSRSLRNSMMPLVIGATVAAFLILMVGMGLVGILWQNVTQRTQELGLRRALGATSGAVQGQILGELLALTTLAVGLGSLLFLQVPLLHFLDFVPGRIFFGGTFAALLLIYPFVLICGLYPSWLAMRVQPAQALQYE